MRVYETRTYPFPPQEVRLIEDLVRRCRPAVGVCPEHSFSRMLYAQKFIPVQIRKSDLDLSN